MDKFYSDYWLWYKPEGDLIRIGIDAQGDEYMHVHAPWYPTAYAPVGKILKAENQGEYLAEIDVAGPMIRCYYAAFDMEIVAVNPRIWGDAYLQQPNELLAADMYGEGWLFLVRALEPEKVEKMFAEWKQKVFTR